MSESLVLVRDVGPVRWLTLNRPDKRNALSADLIRSLRAELRDTGDARALAITGAEPVFSAGADLAGLQALQGASREENLADSLNIADLFQSIAEHPLPVIAAVNGHAIAGGAGLAIACDFAVAVRGAKFGFSEVRIGFVPAIVMNFLLRAVGENVARALCITGRLEPMEDARRLGLVQMLVEPGDLESAVAAIGAEIAAASPEAIARTKALFLRLRTLPLRQGLRVAAEENAEARGTDECREGVAAFLEKRKPNWTPPENL